MRFADRSQNGRPSGERLAETVMGALLVDLFEVVPNVRSVVVYRDGERQNGKRALVDFDGHGPDPEDGLLVTPTLLGLANWRDGSSPDGPDSVIVRSGTRIS